MQCSKTRFLTSLGMTMMPDESVNHSDNNNNIIVLAISVYSLSICNDLHIYHVEIINYCIGNIMFCV